MPLTKKGKRLKAKFISEYKKKGKDGEKIFYAMENSGKLKGVAKKKAKKSSKKK